MQEASARIIIDKLLRESGWVLPGDDGKVNVETETQKEIVQKIEEERKVIEGNEKLIEIYTQKIQDRINKVWSED